MKCDHIKRLIILTSDNIRRLSLYLKNHRRVFRTVQNLRIKKYRSERAKADDEANDSAFFFQSENFTSYLLDEGWVSGLWDISKHLKTIEFFKYVKRLKKYRELCPTDIQTGINLQTSLTELTEITE